MLSTGNASSSSSNNTGSSSQMTCGPCRNPGNMQDPYHIPGYTGHIPTMRYRHGGSFGRTSRNIFEDPCVPLAPIPVLVPMFSPKNAINSRIDQKKGRNTTSQICQCQGQKLNRQIQPPRKQANRPMTASSIQEDKNTAAEVASFKATFLPPENPGGDFIKNANSENACTNANDEACRIEIFQLPCWPPSAAQRQTSRNEKFNTALKNENQSESGDRQRPVTASSGDRTYPQQTLNPDLAKRIQEAFNPTPTQTQNFIPSERKSRHPSRKPSQMCLQNQRPLSNEEDFYPKLSTREMLPVRPHTSYGVPNASSYYPSRRLDNGSSFSNPEGNSWESESQNIAMQNDLSRDANCKSISAELKLEESFNDQRPRTAAEESSQSDGQSFSAQRPGSTTRTNRVNRSPFARTNESCTDTDGSFTSDVDTNIYRCSEAMAPSYSGHVPGYAFYGDGRTYGQATCGTKQYLNKCMLFNRNTDTQTNEH